MRCQCGLAQRMDYHRIMLRTEEEKTALLKCNIFNPVQLPKCSQAAIAYLYEVAGLSYPGCDGIECDHSALPPNFHLQFYPGMPVLYAIEAIERYCE